MIKKAITFKGVDGEDITETWYFNLSEAEIGENILMEGDAESYGERLKEIAAGGNPRRLIETFKELLLNSVGKRAEDSNKFLKSTAIREEFAGCGAYHALLMDLVTNAGTAAQFVNNVFPQAVMDAAKDDESVPVWIQENREPTNAEIKGATRAQLLATYAAREERIRMSKVETTPSI